MKLGDIWIKLGLKKDEFEKGIKGATNSIKNFGNSASKFLGGVAAKFLSIAAAFSVFLPLT